MSWSAEALIQQSESALERCEPEIARKFLERAVQTFPDHVVAYEMLAELYIGINEMQCAHDLLIGAVQKFPQASSSCWIALGQLLGGVEALEAYKNAAQILHANEQDPLRNVKLASVYCLMVEVYTSECCDEPDAEAQCEALVGEAQRTCPTSGEVYVCLGNLRFIQEKIQEANAAMDQFLDLFRADAELKEQNANESAEVIASMTPGMTYEIRMNGAKLLMELGRFEHSAEVLEQLIHEDDREAEIWVMCGMAYSSFEPETAVEYLQKGLEKAEQEQNGDYFAIAQQYLEACLSQMGSTCAKTADSIVNQTSAEDVEMNEN
jgi:predicted Zn-dependent protease